MIREERRLAVYVHWPFCAAKCPYCDFNSHVRPSVDAERWVVALIREIARVARAVPGRTVGSVFFGGGTPSLMPPAGVARLLEAIAAWWPLAADCEVTLEANPNSVEAARFADLRAAGVTRVSIGVQSFDDAALRFLGRAHDAAEAAAAVALAARVFPRYSFDLIYALPGQSLAGWRRALATALERAGEHLSLYQLTIEPGTAFHRARARGDLEPLDDDRAAALFEVTQEVLGAAGMPAYEISNHAAPGGACRHNLAYWRGDDYLGIGPGAHGRLTRDGRVLATEQLRSPERWLAAVEAGRGGDAARTPLDPETRAHEVLMMGLRLAEGIDRRRFAARTGCPLDTIVPAERLAPLVAEELLEDDGATLRATARGRTVLDSVLAALLA